MRPSDVIATAATSMTGAHKSKLRIDAGSLLRSVASLAPELDVFRHPLGFLHVELTPVADCPPSQRVRLHVWSDVSNRWKDDLGSIHDHTWELRSLVLLGLLTDVTYEPKESPDGEHVASRVLYEESGTRIQRLEGRFVLRVVAELDVEAGHVYRLPPGTLHTTEVRKLPTATLVVSHETDRGSASVFGPRGSPGLGTPQRVPAMRDETDRILEQAISSF